MLIGVSQSLFEKLREGTVACMRNVFCMNFKNIITVPATTACHKFRLPSLRQEILADFLHSTVADTSYAVLIQLAIDVLMSRFLKLVEV